MENKTLVTCKYIGHATALIKMGATTILTDPHFERQTVLIKRLSENTVTPASLGELSAIVLTHTHFDHLNIASYKYISCKVPIIVPEGSERAIGRYVPNPIIELSYFAEHKLADGTMVTAFPAKHRSGRVCHLRYTKTNAYGLRAPDMDGVVYFCADSAYGPHFAEAGKAAKIDIAFLPIGAYNPRWLMKYNHMTPAEAVQAFEDLKAGHMIPIHHGTFRLSFEKPTAAAEWMQKIIHERPDLAGRVHLLKSGEEFRAV